VGPRRSVLLAIVGVVLDALLVGAGPWCDGVDQDGGLVQRGIV